MGKPIAMLGAAALLLTFPATPALADGSINEDGTCVAGIPDGQGGFSGIATGTYFSRTTKSGITNFSCHIELTEAQTPSTNTKAANFPCLTPFGLTTDSRINVSPGGSLVMTCSIKQS